MNGQRSRDGCDRPQRVVCIIDDLGRGGAQRQLFELARSIDRSRFDLRVLALSERKVEYVQRLRELDVHVALIHHEGTFSLSTLRRVRRYLLDWRPDAVQTWLFTADFYGRIAARLAGVRVVLSSVRSPEPDKPRHYVLVDRWLSRWTDAFVVNARCTAEVLAQRERLPMAKLRTIVNGVDLSTFDPARHTGQMRSRWFDVSPVFLAGTVGRLQPVKRHPDLLEAFARLASGDSEVGLVIVGEGPDREALERQVRALGVADRVRMPGAVLEVAPALAAMDVFVMPSEYEGCSNAVLEAMAMGKPVIATDVGGNRELLGQPAPGVRREDRPASGARRPTPACEVVDCGILVRLGDVEGLAEAMRMLWNDPQLTRRLGQAGRARACAQFGMERMVRETEALFEEFLNKPRAMSRGT